VETGDFIAIEEDGHTTVVSFYRRKVRKERLPLPASTRCSWSLTQASRLQIASRFSGNSMGPAPENLSKENWSSLVILNGDEDGEESMIP
jgi:hypothetical protein